MQAFLAFLLAIIATTSASQVPANCTDSFCQLSVVPSFQFQPRIGAARSTEATVCCPEKYKDCPANQKICRNLMRYTIPAMPSDPNQPEICPPTDPECVCQIAIGGEIDLTFCPKQTLCCPKCMCIGDPHCTAFNATEQEFIVCDARNSECVNEQDVCQTQTAWDGKPCQWVRQEKVNFCTRQADTVVPFMEFYKKSYTLENNPTVYSIHVNLTLGVYGSINQIDIVDGLVKLQYNFKGQKCSSQNAPGHPFNKNKFVWMVLPSQAIITIQCYEGPPNTRRMDITLEDPSLQLPLVRQQASGFCITDKIPMAALAESADLCANVNRQLALFWKCKGGQTTPITSCQEQWCNKYYKTIDIGVWPQTPQACFDYLQQDLDMNWLYASCSLAPNVALGAKVVVPDDCPENPTCQKCVTDSMDYPQQINQILTTPAPTPNPTCLDLLSYGLNKRVLGNTEKGVEVQYRNGNGTWSSFFALDDATIQSCGCIPIKVTPSDPGATLFFRVGEYQVRQCAYLPVSNGRIDLCNGAPGYNVAVDYLNTDAVSTPFGELWNTGKLACSNSTFPNCPPNYQCCIWTDTNAWNDCMIGRGTPPQNYPNCFKPYSIGRR